MKIVSFPVFEYNRLLMLQFLKNWYHLIIALLANFCFRFPAHNLTVIGVTGTDGKTTTVNLIYCILQKAGKSVSMISSVGAKIGSEDYDLPFHVTTPSSWQLQKFLRMIADRKNAFLVLEVTSHALDQNRTWGIPFKIGVLTNITHEHLDYHKNFQNYTKAKMKLFRGTKYGVINIDDRSYVDNKPSERITYGLTKGDLNLKNFFFQTSLPGEYNQLNCLAAIGAGKALGISNKIIREGIKEFKGVQGRFEYLETGKDFKVLIDFAHTPNGFKNILSTLRPQVKGKLIHVFGCASERDTSKRPIMGSIAAKYDDIIILTEEDYRMESVEKIMDEILGGVDPRLPACRQAWRVDDTATSIFKIPDRQEAINKAISLAKKNDLVLLTGKGHEKSLCRGKVEYPWSEHEAVKRALSR